MADLIYGEWGAGRSFALDLSGDALASARRGVLEALHLGLLRARDAQSRAVAEMASEAVRRALAERDEAIALLEKARGDFEMCYAELERVKPRLVAALDSESDLREQLVDRERRLQALRAVVASRTAEPGEARDVARLRLEAAVGRAFRVVREDGDGDDYDNLEAALAALQRFGEGGTS